MKTGNRDGDALHSDEALMKALAALNTVLQFEQHADIGGLGNEGDNCRECIQNVGEKPHGQLTPEFRAEALFRLFQGLGVASRNNGTPLRACWVPVEAIDQKTGEILESKNDYQKVRICGRSYEAHVAVLILVNNRFPIRGRGPDLDEVGMHQCNNPACRNPLHLKLGSCQQDSNHKVSCGRAAAGPTNGHSTKPEATPRGNLMPHCKLREPMRSEAVSLLKKYCGQRGFARAIAKHCGTTEGIIYSLKRNEAHLEPGVPDTDIELDLKKWMRRENSIEKQPILPVIREIRQRFHEAPIAERSGLLMQFEGEYARSGVWIRRVLAQSFYPDATPEIPIPENFGIGRRNRKKKINPATPND